VESTTISTDKAAVGGKAKSRFGGGGGFGAQKDSLGIYSSGFTGIGGDTTGMGAGGFGGFGKRAAGGPAAKKNQQVEQAPAPNGLRIMGYAKDDQALMEFKDNLMKWEGDPKIEKVYFSEANTEQVPITEMEQARVADRAITRAAAGPATGEDSGRRGGFGSFGGGLGGRGGGATRPNANANMYNPYVEKVVFFKMDLLLKPLATPAAPNAGAAPTSPFGSALFKNKDAAGDAAGDAASGDAAGKTKENPFLKFRNKNKGKGAEDGSSKKSSGAADEG
jgi:hypothetical protein